MSELDAKCERCGRPLPALPSEGEVICVDCIDAIAKELKAETERPSSSAGGVLVTVSAYALGRSLGLERGAKELERQIHAPDRASIPAARCIGRLRHLCDLAVRADTGGTVLGQVRSRHAHEAWIRGADVWVSVDDDVEATTSTLYNLLEAVRGATPRIVVAPCVLRMGAGVVHVVNVEFPRILTPERVLASGARLRPIVRAGFALVAMNRPALAAVRAVSEHLAFVDQDGDTKLGLFHQEIRERLWLTEDFAFFSRVPPTVQVEALLTGCTSHAGQNLVLDDVQP